jgi:phage-related protein
VVRVGFGLCGLVLVENATGLYQAATLEFDCPDPYWVDVVDTVAQASGASGITSFFPFFPLSLSASEIAAELLIDNTGDLEAWPVIAVTGPAVNPTLRNLTSGQVLTLNRTIAAGEIVTLDARPGARTAKMQDGTSVYSLLTSRQWWSLQRGSNRVRLEATGTTAASLLSVSYRRRWLTV